MNEAPAGERRAEAATRGRELLAEQPWAERERELTLLLVRPPLADWASDEVMADVAPACWLLLDAADARTLPQPWGQPLARDGVHRERGEALELTVLTTAAAAAIFEATTRRALEARWTVRHAEPIHDPRAQFEAIRRAAGRLPTEALDRVARPLFLQVWAALDALPHAQASALAVAGEITTVIGRLACLLEEGAYPPVEWLAPAARETRLGRRLEPWLGGLPRVASGEPDALASTARTAQQVFDEVRGALQPDFRDRAWLQDPERFALRPPRG